MLDRKPKAESTLSPRLTRRTAVAASMGAMMLGPATGMLAQDASPSASPSASPVPMEGGGQVVKSSVEGVPDAIIEAPEPYKSYEGTPANGGTIRYTNMIWTQPVTPHDENDFWQEMEKRLGLDSFVVQEIPFETYAEKMAALFASADFGDLLYIHPDIGPRPVIYEALEAGAFLDLTDRLTGENLKKYPNLARFPQQMWDDVRINGRIYGVPQSLALGSSMMWYREDWADTLGLSHPTTPDELIEFFKPFATEDPDGNGSNDTWGTAEYHLPIINGMFRVPNGWRLNDDGTLTRSIETEEWKESVAFMRRFWEEANLHPDTPALEVNQRIEQFNGGRLAAVGAGFVTFFGSVGRQVVLQDNHPEARLTPLMWFGADGGDYVVHPDSSVYGFVAIPTEAATDDDRIDELLRVIDYMYPPFGSEEFIFNDNGFEGIHHTLTETGARELTDKGKAEIAGLLYGFRYAAMYMYHAGYPEHTLHRQQILEEIVPRFQHNPVRGLYSPKDTETGPVLNELINSTVEDVVYGRKPLEALDEMVEEWRQRGGDEVRAEFEELLRNVEEA